MLSIQTLQQQLNAWTVCMRPERVCHEHSVPAGTGSEGGGRSCLRHMRIAHHVECEKLISHHARHKKKTIFTIEILCIETGVKFLSLK